MGVFKTPSTDLKIMYWDILFNLKKYIGEFLSKFKF